MGSVAEDKSHSEKPVTVLVTGFGPFKQEYPVNPSWEITRSLPEWLPPLRAKTANVITPSSHHPGASAGPGSTSTTPAPAPVAIPPVRITVHPEPIRVNYTVVRDLVPKLWNSQQTADPPTSPEEPAITPGEGEKPQPTSTPAEPSQPSLPAAGPGPDIVLHIGMAGPRLTYAIERRGHRDGYHMRDVDGQLLQDDERRAREGKDWVWDGVPAELLTAFDPEDVLRRWKMHCPKHLELRVSEDAGHYLCDFIYFSSLAHLYKTGRRRNVIFLHVPCDASEHMVTLGREIVLQLIRSIVESEWAKHGKIIREEESKPMEVSIEMS